jgi:hypothetical protein
VTDWLSSNRGILMEHYYTKPEGMRPSQKWWLVIIALSRVLLEVNFVVRRLQGLMTLLSEQNQELAALASNLQYFGRQAPQNHENRIRQETTERSDEMVFAQSGQDFATKISIEQFIKDKGATATEICEGMLADEQATVFSSVGHVLVGVRSGIRGLLTGSRDNLLRSDNIPAVLPQELIKGRASDMLPFVQTHRRRLDRTRGSQIVDAIERQLE